MRGFKIPLILEMLKDIKGKSAMKQRKKSSLNFLGSHEPILTSENITNDIETTRQHDSMTAKQYPISETREGKKAVTFYINKASHRQLRLLSIQTEISVQNILVEAMNDYFQKKGLSRTA
jgi:hypothetical protein